MRHRGIRLRWNALGCILAALNMTLNAVVRDCSEPIYRYPIICRFSSRKRIFPDKKIAFNANAD